MGRCGHLADDDRLCEFDAAREHFTLYPGFGRDAATIPPERRKNIGQAVPKRPCGERAMTIELDDVYPVFAVRAWHRGAEHAPHHFRIELRDEAGAVHVVEETENWQATDAAHYRIPGDWTYTSAPITSQFTPVVAREVRYVIDTCSTVDTLEFVRMLTASSRHSHPIAGQGTPGHGWLYELEVFTLLPRWQAWRRFLRER